MLVDYSTFRPPMAMLQAAGVTAVGRYIGWDCEPGFQCIRKNLTLGEKADLVTAGMEIWLSFEYAANAALNGASQGAEDGRLASTQLRQLLMTGMDVYYAVDFNLADYAPALPDNGSVPNARAKLGPVAHYFDAIHASNPNHQVSAYGGYWAMRRLFDAGLIHRGWQTLAWSGTNIEKRCSLIQLIQSVFGAADVDVHASTGEDFGQWPRPVTPPPPPPKVITDGILVSKTMHWTGHRMESSDSGETWREVNE